MTYAIGGLIQATDFNSLVGGPASTTPNTLNAVLGAGAGNAGYGQATVANVVVGNTVAASDWNALVTKTANMATHQGSSITSVTAPVSGSVVSYNAAIPTNLTTIYTNRLNAASQGSSVNTDVTNPSGFNDQWLVNRTVNFANASAARYFFNSGGQIKLQFSHPATYDPRNQMLNTLCAACGTIVISAPNTGSITVSSVSYTGITKIGGFGTVDTLLTTRGYYGMDSTATRIFEQSVDGGQYDNSFIAVNTRYPSGDTSKIAFDILFDINPDPQAGFLDNVTNVRFIVQYPETTNLTNSWGTVTVTT